MTTPKLQMPELVVGQAGKELTHNQALAVLDQLAQAVVVDKDLASPPGSPANGSMYIVAVGATGAWLGQSGKLAYWLTTVAAWTFITPEDGWLVWVADEAKRYERLSGSWSLVASGGGGSGDMLSALLSSEVSVTGATTLTASAFGKMHVCSGTSSDYTIVLPATAGNAGKLIGIRMATGLTKLVTIDGNASENIDGEAARVLWANEVAVLLCDGAGWIKIAGKSVPMSARINATAEQSIPASTDTLVTLPSVAYDNGGLAGTADALVIKRTGSYQLLGHCEFYPTAATRIYTSMRSIALTYYGLWEEGGNNAQYMRQSPLYIGDIPAGEAITLRVLQNGGSSLNTFYGTSQAASLQLVEIIKW